MTNYYPKINGNYTQNPPNSNKSPILLIVVFVIGLLTITSWMFLITPNLKNDSTAFADLREYDGKDAYVTHMGDKLPPLISSKDVLEYNVVNVDGDVLEINSTYITYDTITGEKIYENSNMYFVDRITGKHIDDKEYYFKFPINVKKQNYLLIDPNVETPATFVFEEVTYIDNLEVYVFSCSSFGADFSGAWPEFSPEKIYADQTCKTTIEPITGKTIQFSLTWDMYAIQDGKHISVEQGESETTDFTERILLQSAKNAKQLFHIYDFLIPIFIILIFTAIFFISLYNKRLREKNKIIIKQLQELQQASESKIELLENQAKLEKFSIIGKLSSRLSHDIRNPLNVIKMGISLIDLEYNEKFTEETRIKIQRIKRAIDRISHQVDDVLDFVRTKPLSLKSISMKTILLSSLESMEIPKGIKLTLPKSDVSITADPQQMETVFSNLIINSVQSLGEFGEIEIKFTETLDHIEIQVIDSGPGIPEDKLDKIFEPLFTTKQIGTGLGLSSCKTIIENHGGTISVKNNPTTFIIVLSKNTKISEK